MKSDKRQHLPRARRLSVGAAVDLRAGSLSAPSLPPPPSPACFGALLPRPSQSSPGLRRRRKGAVGEESPAKPLVPVELQSKSPPVGARQSGHAGAAAAAAPSPSRCSGGRGKCLWLPSTLVAGYSSNHAQSSSAGQKLPHSPPPFLVEISYFKREEPATTGSRRRFPAGRWRQAARATVPWLNTPAGPSLGRSHAGAEALDLGFCSTAEGNRIFFFLRH